jgi:hypothetical protein
MNKPSKEILKKPLFRNPKKPFKTPKKKKK